MERERERHADAHAEHSKAEHAEEAHSKTSFTGQGQLPPVSPSGATKPKTASEQAFGGESREFHEYKKIGTVKAEHLTSPMAWKSSGGDDMKAEAGDWKITGADGSSWSVKPDIFATTYTQVTPGVYAKTAITKAAKLTKATTVQTLEGTGSGQAGDYLVVGPKGEQYIVPKAKFESTYALKK